MDKKIICAVAGSGKTTKLVDSINDNHRYLLVTYTRENVRSIKAGLVKKFGRVPGHVYLATYFSFLYRFCYRPFFHYRFRDKSFTWNFPPFRRGAPDKTRISHYMTKSRYLYANRTAKLIIETNTLEKVIRRLEKHFDYFYIDEIQDFAANDFNFILGLAEADVKITFVGDYYQHTFDTSRDGNIRTNLHKKGLKNYLAEFEKAGFEIDLDALKKSYRCSPTVCEFISRNLGIKIESHRTDQTKLEIVNDPARVRVLFKDDRKVKLFFESHSKYDCFSNNWGRCKGINEYGDVCVVLNPKSYQLFKKGELHNLPDGSKNKLYVACSRASGNLYILNIDDVKKIVN